MKTVLSLLLLFACGASALGETIKARGKIFLPEESKPAFFFEHSHEKKGNGGISKAKFTDKEGKSLVEEEFHYEAGALAKYSYNQIQMDERGTIEIRDGKVHYNYTAQGKTDTDSEDLEPNIMLPDMIAPFLWKHWDELMGGATLKVQYLLLERQRSIGFKFYKDKERQLNGKEAVDFIMKATNIFIAQLAPKIRFTLEKAPPHRVLETFGRMPIRVPEVPNPKRRKDYKAIDARMEMEYLE